MKKLALGLLIVVTFLPAASAADDLAVDPYLQSGLVTSEFAAAPHCPVPALLCTAQNQDCGEIPGVCSCKGKRNGPWVCLKNF